MVKFAPRWTVSLPHLFFSEITFSSRLLMILKPDNFLAEKTVFRGMDGKATL